MSAVRLQVLREIDKLDRIGVDGVCAMLGDGVRDSSGAFNKGVGLHPLQIGIIREFLEIGGDNPLGYLSEFFSKISLVRTRVALMAALEDTTLPDGSTAWDRLIAMRENEDNTWSDGGRPRNIAWALDDLIEKKDGDRG